MRRGEFQANEKKQHQNHSKFKWEMWHTFRKKSCGWWRWRLASAWCCLISAALKGEQIPPRGKNWKWAVMMWWKTCMRFQRRKNFFEWKWQIQTQLDEPPKNACGTRSFGQPPSTTEMGNLGGCATQIRWGGGFGWGGTRAKEKNPKGGHKKHTHTGPKKPASIERSYKLKNVHLQI